MSRTSPASGSPPEAAARPSAIARLEAATSWLLLGLASTVLVGYRYGDSNHAVTVPILKRLIEPALYRWDPMLETGEGFPTVFYRLLALLLPSTDWVAPAFFVLYVATMAATYAAIYRIGVLAGGPAVGALTLLVAFPVRLGLAGEAVYRVAFSHSHVASALALWAIAWFLGGRRLLPILVLSLGAYNHALYSAYVLVPLLLVVLAEARQAGRRRTLTLIAAAALPWLPLAGWALARSAPLTEDWLTLLRLRSAHHSFPSAFGEDLPAAAALLLLAAFAYRRLGARFQVLLAAFLGSTALHFVTGSYLTEYEPVRLVLQYQPHRAWRFLMVLLWAAAASAIVADYRAGGRSRALALAVGTVLLLPGLAPLLPVAAALVAFFSIPATPMALRALAAVVFVGVAGWGLQDPAPLAEVDKLARRIVSDSVVSAAGLALLLSVACELPGRARGLVTLATLGATLLWLGPSVYADAALRWRPELNPWTEVQEWVREHTPHDAVLLTPPQQAGFRVFSERAIVGEWKDGTQQYFDDAFAGEWHERMQALGADTYERRLGRELLPVAQRYAADYIVLPSRPIREGLILLHANAEWAVYRAEWQAEHGGGAAAVDPAEP